MLVLQPSLMFLESGSFLRNREHSCKHNTVALLDQADIFESGYILWNICYGKFI